MKQLDFMLAKSKQKSLQNRSINGEHNENFYRSEKENFFNNNNNVDNIDNDEINNNEMIEQNQFINNINDKFHPSYKKIVIILYLKIPVINFIIMLIMIWVII